MSEYFKVPPAGLLRYRWSNRVLRTLPAGFRHVFKGILFHKVLRKDRSTTLANGYTFGLASQEDVERISQHEEALKEEGVYTRRLGKGHACYCLKYQNDVLCYNWIAFDNCYRLCGYRQELRFLPLTCRQAFTYDFYTYRKYRRLGHGIKLKELLMAELQKIQIEEIFSLVLHHNVASLKIHFLHHYDPKFMVYGYRLGPWFKVIYGESQDSKALVDWAKCTNLHLRHSRHLSW